MGPKVTLGIKTNDVGYMDTDRHFLTSTQSSTIDHDILNNHGVIHSLEIADHSSSLFASDDSKKIYLLKDNFTFDQQ